MRPSERIYGLGVEIMVAAEGRATDVVQRVGSIMSESETLQLLKAQWSSRLTFIWRDLREQVGKAMQPDAGFRQSVRQAAIQFGLYGMIITGSVSVTFAGSEMLISMLSNKMVEMASSVVQDQLLPGIETASLRPALQ